MLAAPRPLEGVTCSQATPLRHAPVTPIRACAALSVTIRAPPTNRSATMTVNSKSPGGHRTATAVDCHL